VVDLIERVAGVCRVTADAPVTPEPGGVVGLDTPVVLAVGQQHVGGDRGGQHRVVVVYRRAGRPVAVGVDLDLVASGSRDGIPREARFEHGVVGVGVAGVV